MKIIFIGQKGIPSLSGGVEKHVEELAVRLAAQGHEVMAYTRSHYNQTSENNYKGVKLINLPSLKTKNLDAITHTFLACLDLIRRPVDIIHFHSIGPSSLIWFARLVKPGVKIVSTFHCQDYYHQKWSFIARLYLKFGEWMACRAADKTITVSKTLRAYVSNQYLADAEYVPNGVPAADRHAAEEITKQWGLSKDSYVLAVSRLVRHKGIHHLINAFKRLDTTKRLVIAGEGSFTDEYVTELKELAREDERIIFVGAQYDSVLKELLSNAFVFVQPSESEGLSIALLEAMSYGNAVITSDIPENKEAVGDTALTFSSKDERELEDRLNLLLNDPVKAESLGKAAEERATSQYSWTDIVTATEGLYATLMTEGLVSRLKRTTITARLSLFL